MLHYLLSSSITLLAHALLFSVTSSGHETREWKHKVCNNKFWQQKNNIGTKSWNTGVFTKKLETVAKGNKREFFGKAKYVRRVQYILSMRGNTSVTPQVSKEMKFFPFEEDIIHQIDEAFVICSTGVGMCFFSDPFVREWLRRIEPRHRPIYRVKLLKVIRCIQDVLQSEVRHLF